MGRNYLTTRAKVIAAVWLWSMANVLACDDCGCDIESERSVDLSQLRVTSGKLKQTRSLFLSIQDPQSRAVISKEGDKNDTGQKVSIRFRYRGASAVDKPLASGTVRRQIGMKLASADSCNLLYVMWEVEPVERISVFIKSNPGLHTSAECGARGYTRLQSDVDFSSVPLATARDTTTTHRLAAHLKPVEGTFDESIQDYRDFQLVVCADNRRVFEKTLIDFPVEMRGSPGIRTDNGSFIFKFYSE